LDSLEAILEDVDRLLVFHLLFAQPFDQTLLLQHHLAHIVT
jgi:hypothetical protein